MDLVNAPSGVVVYIFFQTQSGHKAVFIMQKVEFSPCFKTARGEMCISFICEDQEVCLTVKAGVKFILKRPCCIRAALYQWETLGFCTGEWNDTRWRSRKEPLTLWTPRADKNVTVELIWMVMFNTSVSSSREMHVRDSEAITSHSGATSRLWPCVFQVD